MRFLTRNVLDMWKCTWAGWDEGTDGRTDGRTDGQQADWRDVKVIFVFLHFASRHTDYLWDRQGGEIGYCICLLLLN
jgi:hypothetical protein